VGSRVHGAASACIVTVGLFFCGLGGALALADPSGVPPPPPGSHADDPPGKDAPGESEGSRTKDSPSPDDKPDTATGKPGNGTNPDNGNCGNKKRKGNAHGCKLDETQTWPQSATDPPTTGTTPTTGSTTPSPTPPTSSAPTTTTSSVGLPAPGGGGGAVPQAPRGGGALPPRMQLPPAAEPSVIDSVPGAPAADVPVPPITLPVIIAPAAGLGAGGAPPAPALPAAPRAVSAEPPAGREPLPANAGGNAALPPVSYRIGYADYLRNAGLSQVAALAVPGVAGILLLTGAGGLVGYRQAKAGRAVHTSATARFVN
jgi:hypothetical protein